MRPVKKIISVLVAAVTIALWCGASFSSDFVKKEQAFSKGTFTLDLPPGYTEAQKQIQEKVEVYGFSTPAREDGTRGVILVTIVDLSGDEDVREMELGDFLAAMLRGVKNRRTHWEEGNTVRMILNDVPVARVEWSGDAVLGTKDVHMKGIMYAGMVGDIAFVLHAQDLDTYTDEALPLCDRAMKTFQLTVKK